MKISEIFSKKRSDEKDSRRGYFERRATELTERLAEIRSLFDFAEDEPIIEALIYEEKSVLCLMESLYKEARAEGISLELHERLTKN